MWCENYDWHFDYPRLAFDTGFSFKSRKTTKNFKRESLAYLDVNKIIQDRNTSAIEKYIPYIIQYNLDNDQTSILDSIFVKVFHLSQLAVEYLLFCKTYLDNTVVILKKNLLKNSEEISDLKLEVSKKEKELDLLQRDEIGKKCSKLQYHTYSESSLPFQCVICSKIFATREFLEAHNKRRHETKSFIYEEETNQLLSEIKELKQRLNTTEKLVHNNKDFTVKEKLHIAETSQSDDDKKMIKELQKNFEKLKNDVQDEIKNINFSNPGINTNHEKFFEIFLEKIDYLVEKSKDSLLENKALKSLENAKFIDNYTQTDTRLKQINQSFFGYNKEQQNLNKSESKIITKMLLDLKKNIEYQLESFETSLTQKVSYSLEKLNTQIRNINKELQNLETLKHHDLENSIKKEMNETNLTENKKNVELTQKPIPKKRSFVPKKKEKFVEEEEEQEKFNEISKVVQEFTTGIKFKKLNNSESNNLVIPEIQENNKSLPENNLPNLKKISPRKVLTKTSSNSVRFLFNKSLESDLSSSSEENMNSLLKKKTQKSHYDQTKLKFIPKDSNKSISSLKETSMDPKILQNLKKELKEFFSNRLASFGISHSQMGISKSYFNKVISEINQQKTQMKKKHPMCTDIMKEIVKKLEARLMVETNKIQLKDFSSLNSERSTTKQQLKTKTKIINDEIEKIQSTQNKIPKLQTSYSSSNSFDDITALTGNDHLKKHATPSKKLLKSYQSYDDVIKEIHEKIQNREAIQANQDIISSSETKLRRENKNSSIFNKNQSLNDTKAENLVENEKINVMEVEVLNEIEEKESYFDYSNLSEVKLTNKKTDHQKLDDDTEKTSKILPQFALNKTPIKKKVIFNVVTKQKCNDDDTTSVNSSVFDESPKGKHKSVGGKEDSEYSDYNFSEILTLT